MLARPNWQDLGFIGELLATGQLQALIDRSYPLAECTDAFCYLGGGHAAGKVVIWMNGDEGETPQAPSFDIYGGEYFEQVVGNQLRFFATVLSPASAQM